MKARAGVKDRPPEKVIAWLKTPAGEQWSEQRLGTPLYQHLDDSGVFASVLRDGSACCLARWPVPLRLAALDDGAPGPR